MYSREDELIRRMMKNIAALQGAARIRIDNYPLPPLPPGVVLPEGVQLPVSAAAATTVTVDGITYELKVTAIETQSDLQQEPSP